MAASDSTEVGEEGELDDDEAMAESASVIRLVNEILAEAVANGQAIFISSREKMV